MSPRDKKSFSVSESARFLGRCTKTVRRYIKQGILEAHQIHGKFGPEIRVSKKSLDDLLKRMSTASNPLDDPYEVLQLYRKAPPDVKELVRKILNSKPEEGDQESRKGLLRPFFWKRGSEKS